MRVHACAMSQQRKAITGWAHEQILSVTRTLDLSSMTPASEAQPQDATQTHTRNMSTCHIYAAGRQDALFAYCVPLRIIDIIR
eukprot:6346974-Amphidinium_carterae.1